MARWSSNSPARRATPRWQRNWWRRAALIFATRRPKSSRKCASPRAPPASQLQIIEAMGWPIPTYAHLPLLHGEDGAKLSKRHGALGIHEYAGLGYLPEAMRNYLLRLGWSHGDDETISTEQAIEWFNLE